MAPSKFNAQILFGKWMFAIHNVRKNGVSTNLLIGLVTAWLLLFANAELWALLWKLVFRTDEINWLLAASLPVLVFAWVFTVLSLLSWGRLAKPLLCLVLISAAFASYFMNAYGIVIDYTMFTNVVETDVGEVSELLNWKLFLWVAMVGGLPVCLISQVPLRRKPWTKALANRLIVLSISVVTLSGIVLSQYQSYASLLRNNREIRLILVPTNLFAAGHGYLKRQLATPKTLTVIGADAVVNRQGTARKPKLLVLAVGETARSANFSLNGYSRDTNPELQKRNVISFSNVSSCGTATAVSLPCMFLDVGKDEYKDGLAKNREGLLDVLQRAGISVMWTDNNSGCKGVCDRVPNRKVVPSADPQLCTSDECKDGVLLAEMEDFIKRQAGDAVLVLHYKGSHGPAYYKRYPSKFRKFEPVCETNELDKCKQQEVVNAYDNSILYTDYVTSGVIDILASNTKFDTALLYVSDHGESLGEGGLYLHGLPYAMAPDEQTKVPLVLWMSDSLAKSEGLNVGCLRTQENSPLSHDNLFHTVLGMMDVQTSSYRSALDLTTPCKAPRG
ncbi:phosphoethanolamine transferase [Pseudomonas sichuanensis]|uniref:phosphoethanolamine transferase n=1 Tax=Pseudomonas sichuanensis TaxID=2213015 RepID=UPI002AB87BEF|nr:phosphoethanolamine--lipid A transferase [Pseudomonas sichuanensis]MDZ4020599.1 Phosphoethanolamine transferase EptA [Pseudomonas sichuanensis]